MKNITKLYNIALIPQRKATDFVALAAPNQLCSNGYCIGARSVPHVTVCRFLFNSSKVEALWKTVCGHLNEHSFKLSFHELSKVTFDKHTYWISIIPNEKEVLHALFDVVSQHVMHINNGYDPHLTLFNYPKGTRLACLEDKSSVSIEDDFELVMGESDSIGQLVKVLFNS